MKVPLRWLKEYIDIPMSPQELAHRLTMSGTEVGGIQTVGNRWDGIVISKVLALEPHPNADRLQLATVDLGKNQVTVVTGAPNLAVGQRVPFAPVGAELIDPYTGKPTKLKAAKIRGIVSEGMVCSEKELGISEAHEGIMVLPDDTPIGAPLVEVLGDTILDLDLTPNRPDCLSIIGIAREVAALTKQEVRLPASDYEEQGTDIHGQVEVRIEDPDLCSRYTASLITSIRIKPSPAWLQERLMAVGMRPINNIVDITNYVMMEYGQPLHAFDFAKVRGAKIIVRRARPGERLLTLDGVDRTLEEDMLLITDGGGPVALAGVMGGIGSEVTDETTAVLLESANFNQASIRRTSAKTRLRSEASARFDKGLSPELPLPALRRATKLMLDLAGGKVAKGVVDVYPVQQEPQPVLLTTARIKRVLGVELSERQIVDTLGSLGFTIRSAAPTVNGEAGFHVVPPYWRTDVRIPDDVVEELARIIGYDELPTSTLSGELPKYEPSTGRVVRERIRDILVDSGMQEIVTYSLVSWNLLSKVYPSGDAPEPTPLHVANPMSQEYEYLRTTLRPALLATLSSNQRHAEEAIRLFEIGRVYLPQNAGLPDEREMIVGVLSGRRWDRSWLASDDGLTFYDAKGILESLFVQLGIDAVFEASADPILHPGKTAKLLVAGTEVGIVGEVHPRVAERFDLSDEPVYLFELELAKLIPFVGSARRYQPLPRFPGVKQDIALLVDRAVPGSRIEGIIRSHPLVGEVVLFDVYEGKGIPAGKKSLAYAVVYRAPNRTLTDDDVRRAQSEILKRLAEQTGAVQRG